jgi:hypothetical protein
MLLYEFTLWARELARRGGLPGGEPWEPGFKAGIWRRGATKTAVEDLMRLAGRALERNPEQRCSLAHLESELSRIRRAMKPWMWLGRSSFNLGGGQ